VGLLDTPYIRVRPQTRQTSLSRPLFTITRTSY